MLFLTQVGDPEIELIPHNDACIFGISLKAYAYLLWLFLSSYVPSSSNSRCAYWPCISNSLIPIRNCHILLYLYFWSLALPSNTPPGAHSPSWSSSHGPVPMQAWELISFLKQGLSHLIPLTQHSSCPWLWYPDLAAPSLSYTWESHRSTAWSISPNLLGP